MFEYMTAQEAAELWSISVRRVQRLCKENRIEGVLNINRVWLIPKAAIKPVDKRRRVDKNLKNL
jgi:excisionase family DNA binding protein